MRNDRGFEGQRAEVANAPSTAQSKVSVNDCMGHPHHTQVVDGPTVNLRTVVAQDTVTEVERARVADRAAPQSVKVIIAGLQRQPADGNSYGGRDIKKA